MLGGASAQVIGCVGSRPLASAAVDLESQGYWFESSRRGFSPGQARGALWQPRSTHVTAAVGNLVGAVPEEDSDTVAGVVRRASGVSVALLALGGALLLSGGERPPAGLHSQGAAQGRARRAGGRGGLGTGPVSRAVVVAQP